MIKYLLHLLHNLLSVIILCSMLINCSIINIKNKVDPQLQSFHDEFIHYAEIKNPTTIVVFGDLPGGGDVSGAIGVCNYLFKRVTIDRRYWKEATLSQKRALMWHELGHCELFMGHNDKMIDRYCPQSLMHPYLAPEGCLQLYWERYKLEFRRK